MGTLKNKTNDAAARLEAMRARMSQHHSQSGGFNYWKPAVDGKEIVRILPPVGNMGYFWQEVGTHELHKGEDGLVRCPRFTTGEERPCPICEMADQAYRENDIELSKSLRVRRAYHMNVMLRAAKNTDKEDQGPLIWTPGIQVFEKLAEIVGDPEYGDITDLYNGCDLMVARKGSGLATEYHINPRRDRSSLDGVKEGDGEANGEANGEKIEEILKNAIDLSRVLDSLPSYDDLLAKLGAAPTASSANESESEEDDFPDK